MSHYPQEKPHLPGLDYNTGMSIRFLFQTAGRLALLVLLVSHTAAFANPKALRLGQAPDKWTLKRLDTPKTEVLNSQFGSKATLLFFWHPRCKLCVEQLKDLNTTALPQGVKAVTVASVNQNDLAKAKAIAATVKLPSFQDEQLRVAYQFQAVSLPAYYILGPGGVMLTPPPPPPRGVTEKLDVYDDRSLLDLLKYVAKAANAPAMVNPQDKMVGRPAPPLSLPDLTGKTVDLATLKGSKGGLVIFYSPTCPHCQRELPRFKEWLETSGRAKGYKIIAAAMGNSEQAVKNARDYQTQQNYPWPSLLDPNGHVLQTWKVSAYPTFYAVDGDLKIRAFGVGRLEDIGKWVKKALGN